MITNIDTTTWERSSSENWSSPSSNSLKMLVNLNHDYIVSDVNYSNYTISSDVTVKGGDDDGIGVVFDYVDSDNYKYIMYHGGGLSGWTNVYNPINGVTPKIILVEVKDGIHERLSYNMTFPAWAKNSTFNIKLSNVFSDILFYVNDIETIRYKKPDSSLGKIGFVTYSQVADFNNIKIYKTHTNRIEAKFKLVGIGDSETYSEVIARVQDKNEIYSEIIPRIFEDNYKNMEIDVKYRGIDDVLVEIQPYGFTDVDVEIYVRPHNKMWAIYDVIQPPIVQQAIVPVMDAFTRSESRFSSINYGTGASIVVGRDENYNTWNTYIKFDLESMNPSIIYLGAKLRLYTANYMDNIGLEVLEISEDWQEYSITHLNAPNNYGLVLADTYEYNIEKGYIEFELTDKILEWIKNPKNNKGFTIRAKNDVTSQAIFRTREHQLKPEIILSYYDPSVFSGGRSQISTEINVMKRGNSNHNVEIEVGSVFGYSTHDVYIYARQPDVPIEDDIEVEITATKDNPHTEITVGIRKESYLNVELNVLSGTEVDKLDVEITVNRNFALVEIFSAYRDDKDVYIYSRAIDDSSIDSEISVTRDYVDVELEVVSKENSEVETEISVSRDYVDVEIYARIHNDVEVEIEVDDIYYSRLDAEIIASKPLIPVEITPRVPQDHSILTSIDVTKNKIEIIIAVKERSTVDVEIDVIHQSSFDTEIVVSMPLTHAEITPRVKEENSLDSEIYVKWTDFKEVEIYARATSKIDVDLDVKATSSVKTEITISKPDVAVEIRPRIEGLNNKHVIIEPRILVVENMDTIIVVGSKRRAYGFVM